MTSLIYIIVILCLSLAMLLQKKRCLKLFKENIELLNRFDVIDRPGTYVTVIRHFDQILFANNYCKMLPENNLNFFNFQTHTFGDYFVIKIVIKEFQDIELYDEEFKKFKMFESVENDFFEYLKSINWTRI